MAEQINALLVHVQDETRQTLEQILKSLSLEVVLARNCQEAARLLKRPTGIDVVFTGVDLPDGNWTAVLELAQQSKSYMPVIVASRMVDLELYLEALGKGAFDFITPPFLTSDIAPIIRSAIYKELLSAKQSLSAPPAA
ncbi:MAG TPA: response regulator [Terriglobia bacterium]|nr:response regulator [Terriglobia bacterium]